MKFISTFAITVATILGVAVLFILPTYFLWNHIIPRVFGLPEIGLIDTFCLVALSSILFKNH